MAQQHKCTPGKIQRRSQGCLKPYIRYRVCSMCGKEEILGLSEDVEPHAYNVIKDVKATCTEDGIKILKCNQCGQEKEPVIIKAPGHNIKKHLFYEKCVNKNCDYKKTNIVSIIITASVFAVFILVSIVLIIINSMPDRITETSDYVMDITTTQIVPETTTSQETGTAEATAEDTTAETTPDVEETEETTYNVVSGEETITEMVPESPEEQTVPITLPTETEDITTIPLTTTEPEIQTTVVPATEIPTTMAPTTVAPTTMAPTTEAPTEPPTVAPATEAPTETPTTVVPTTAVPTTEAPTEAPATNNNDYSYLAGQIITGSELTSLVSALAPVEVIDTFGSKHYFNIAGKWGNPEVIIDSDSYVISMIDTDGKQVILANKF